ncbi:MAG: metallophosphoesterase family protein [Halobacteriota archaeon]|nr:metallophosphoesterase family protein [Halobacteriota archaeon]
MSKSDCIGLISDIHGNLEAFKKVLKEIEEHDCPIFCLGDVVGYGADPNEVIELVIEKNIRCIMGNHDAAAIGKMDTTWFNERARRAIEWTSNELTKKGRNFLESLKKEMRFGDAYMVHGSPMDPISEYVDNSFVAEESLNFVDDIIIIVGHTHVPCSFSERVGKIELERYLHGGTFTIDTRSVLNPGSVGQPRDGNPMASYAILEFSKREFTVFRTYYDIGKASEKILKAGIPKSLAERLFIGL